MSKTLTPIPTSAIFEAIDAFDVPALARMAKSVEAGTHAQAGGSGSFVYQCLVQSSFRSSVNGAELLEGLKLLVPLCGPPTLDDDKLLGDLFSKGDGACLDWARGLGLTISRTTLHRWIDHTLAQLQHTDLIAQCGWIQTREIGLDFDCTLLAMATLRGDDKDQLDDLLGHIRAHSPPVGRGEIKRELGVSLARVIYRHAAMDDVCALRPSDGGCAWLEQHCPARAIKAGAQAVMMDEECEETLIDPLCRETIPLGAANYRAHQIDQATPAVSRSLSSRRI